MIAAIANLEFDPTFQLQQYGVAALDFVEAPATFTRTATHTWQGEALAPGVAVQGNMLTGPEVVADAMAAFQKDPSLPLADRLLAALGAGAARGGDSRCGAQKALSAYLLVARPGDQPRDPTVKLIVPGQERGGPNPIAVLRQQFERARRR